MASNGVAIEKARYPWDSGKISKFFIKINWKQQFSLRFNNVWENLWILSEFLTKLQKYWNYQWVLWCGFFGQWHESGEIGITIFP